MMEQTILGLATMVMTLASQPAALAVPFVVVEQEQILAKENLDLTKRLPNEYGARVFADNILLSLHYLKGDILNSKGFPELNGQKFRESDWNRVPGVGFAPTKACAGRFTVCSV